jgi:hypothetical protein
MWQRRLILLVVAFAAGVAVAELFGAVNLGTALAVGQLSFAAMLVWVLMTG